MEKNLIHSNELHFIDKKRIHRAVEQLAFPQLTVHQAKD